ncbi:unnamed protein product [Closterium sp. Naga37s-1]|nr:unnamed protein product [Closterium sp. Naga37s-1]
MRRVTRIRRRHGKSRAATSSASRTTCPEGSCTGGGERVERVDVPITQSNEESRDKYDATTESFLTRESCSDFVAIDILEEGATETAVDPGRIDLHYSDVRELWGYDPHPEHGVRPCSVASFFIMQASAARHADATRGMVAAAPRHRSSADETGTNGASAAGADGDRETTEHARRWVDRGSRGGKRSGAGAAVQEEVMEDPDELIEEVTVAQRYVAFQPVAVGEVAVGMEMPDGKWEVLTCALAGQQGRCALAPSRQAPPLCDWLFQDSGAGGMGGLREWRWLRGGMRGGVRGGMYGDVHGGVGDGMHGGVHSVVPLFILPSSSDPFLDPPYNQPNGIPSSLFFSHCFCLLPPFHSPNPTTPVSSSQLLAAKLACTTRHTAGMTGLVSPADFCAAHMAALEGMLDHSASVSAAAGLEAGGGGNGAASDGGGGLGDKRL